MRRAWPRSLRNEGLCLFIYLQVNCRGSKEETPLHIACSNNSRNKPKLTFSQKPWTNIRLAACGREDTSDSFDTRENLDTSLSFDTSVSFDTNVSFDTSVSFDKSVSFDTSVNFDTSLSLDTSV